MSDYMDKIDRALRVDGDGLSDNPIEAYLVSLRQLAEYMSDEIEKIGPMSVSMLDRSGHIKEARAKDEIGLEIVRSMSDNLINGDATGSARLCEEKFEEDWASLNLNSAEVVVNLASRLFTIASIHDETVLALRDGQSPFGIVQSAFSRASSDMVSLAIEYDTTEDQSKLTDLYVELLTARAAVMALRLAEGMLHTVAAKLTGEAETKLEARATETPSDVSIEADANE